MSTPPAPADNDHPSAIFGDQINGHAETGTFGVDADTFFVAWLGRTSKDDVQDPTLSLPRQLSNCRAALPPNFVIVAFFWDVESGRKALSARGTGAHDKFDIPIPRDGGIPELLAEAARRDRRFDGVICESIDRVARITYYSTQVEHELERLGVALFAADEGIETTRRKSTKLLIRRTKQMLAEWYVRQMLELSWDGLCEHTKQGWNVGAPPYGYQGERVPHPVPARRAEGKSKTKLVPDPIRAPVVHQIYAWRVGERLSYSDIRDRLNADLDRYPPPVSPDPARQRNTWNRTAVRDILNNPKHTGYMVWNRRASKTAKGKVNAPREWVWSPLPTHEPIVTLDVFRAARDLAPQRERSRSAPGPNLAHPQTKRSYLLRSYVFCTRCQRRMFGKTRKGLSYFACQPNLNHGKADAALRFPGHPASIWIREDALIDGVVAFFAQRIFGPDRRAYLAEQFADVDTNNRTAALRRVERLRRGVTDLEARKARLIQALEREDDPDGTVFRDVRDRLRQLSDERTAKLAELAAANEDLARAPSAPELLDNLYLGEIDLRAVPEDKLRGLFDAFRLEVHYDRSANLATCRVTIATDTLATIHDAVAAVASRPAPHSQRRRSERGRGGATCFPSASCPRQDSNLRHTV